MHLLLVPSKVYSVSSYVLSLSFCELQTAVQLEGQTWPTGSQLLNDTVQNLVSLN